MDTEEAGWINRGEVASGVGVGQFLRGLAKEIGYKAHTDFEGRLEASRQTEQQDSAASEATGTAAVTTMEVEQEGSPASAASGIAAATTMETEQEDSAASAATGAAAAATTKAPRVRSEADRRRNLERQKLRKTQRKARERAAASQLTPNENP